MKRILILLLVSSLSLAAKAQQEDTKPFQINRFYAGIGVNGRHLIMDYSRTWPFSAYAGPFIALPYLHLGYQFNKRIQIEVGTAFSSRKDHTYITHSKTSGKVIEYHTYSHTKALTVPVKINHTLFDLRKKHLTLYGTGSFLPVYATTQIKQTEVEGSETTTTLNIEDSGFNAFASFGIGAGFKIWKQISGYCEINILDRNLATGESIYPNNDIYIRVSPFLKVFKGLGINYNFQAIKQTTTHNN